MATKWISLYVVARQKINKPTNKFKGTELHRTVYNFGVTQHTVHDSVQRQSFVFASSLATNRAKQTWAWLFSVHNQRRQQNVSMIISIIMASNTQFGRIRSIPLDDSCCNFLSIQFKLRRIEMLTLKPRQLPHFRTLNVYVDYVCLTSKVDNNPPIRNFNWLKEDEICLLNSELKISINFSMTTITISISPQHTHRKKTATYAKVLGLCMLSIKTDIEVCWFAFSIIAKFIWIIVNENVMLFQAPTYF